jgi:hypothetical protein
MKLTWTLLLAGGVTAFQSPRSNKKAPYIVPDSEHLAPDAYIVRFHANHSLEDHFQNIGFDVRQFAAKFLDMPMSNAYLVFLSEGNSSFIHDHIRHDPGVARVNHDEYIHGEQIGELAPTKAPPPRTKHRKSRLHNIGKRWVNAMTTSDRWNFGMISKGSTWGGPVIGYPLVTTLVRSWYMKDSGAGVYVYVFDSGIRIEHQAFQGFDGRHIAAHFNGLKATDQSPYCAAGQTMVSFNILLYLSP